MQYSPMILKDLSLFFGRDSQIWRNVGQISTIEETVQLSKLFLHHQTSSVYLLWIKSMQLM